MMATLAVLAVAVTDLLRLLRTRLAPTSVLVIQLIWWIGLAAAALIWVRPGWWSGLIAAALAVGWWAVADRVDGSVEADEIYPWSVVVLVAVTGVLAWFDLEVVHSGYPGGLLWLALALFLTQTGNRITRAVLRLSGRDTVEGLGSVPASGLKGGRFIGPLERIFITVLAVVGAYHVVAALMAAKGIVRFPEISADARRANSDDDEPTATAGTKAEEFLVGSLASWGLAGGGALLVLVLQ